MKKLADFLLYSVTLICGGVIGTITLTILDTPPIEIRGAIPINHSIFPGEELEIRELVIKRRACASDWTIHILSYPDNRVVHTYTEPGGIARITGERIQTIVWPVKLPRLSHGRYLVRASGKYESCGSWLRTGWTIQLPDVYFNIVDVDIVR